MVVACRCRLKFHKVGIGALRAQPIDLRFKFEEDFIWKISAGPNFELFIENWGEDADRFSKFKKQLLEDDIFKTTVIKETTKTLFYKRGLKDPVLVDKYKHISYHVYALIPLHGFYYEIKNKPQGDSKETAEMMLTSLNSFKSFEP